MALNSKPKGILKKPSINFQPKQPRLTWDEDNIQLTEGQKDSTMKITEPKTPYIHYNQETDEIMTDLEKIPGLALGTSNLGSTSLGSTSLGGGSNNISPVGSFSSTSPSSAHFPDSIKDDEWDSETEEDEESREKRRKFAQLRAKHYNMKEALKLGHKLVEEDVDDDEKIKSIKQKLIIPLKKDDENDDNNNKECNKEGNDDGDGDGEGDDGDGDNNNNDNNSNNNSNTNNNSDSNINDSNDSSSNDNKSNYINSSLNGDETIPMET